MGMNMVIVMVLALVAGVGIGYWWGRSSSSMAKQKHDLEQQLLQRQRDFENYRQQVNQHFGTTASLINNMTSSYRAVFEHLVQGAHRLATAERTQVELEDSAHDLPPEAAPTLYTARPLEQSDVDDLEARMYDAEAAAFKAVVSSVDHMPKTPTRP